MTRYLIMSCEFILTVNLMFNMSCPKPSCSHFQLNELVLNNFKLMYNVTVSLCNMLNECHCPVYDMKLHIFLLFILFCRFRQYIHLAMWPSLSDILIRLQATLLF